MADVYITIPGDPGVQVNLNDTLYITYNTPAKFCISEGNPDWFNPPLPVGVAEPQGHVYSGTVLVAAGTVKYSHVGHDKSCGSPNPKNVPPGTIQIGTGIQ